MNDDKSILPRAMDTLYQLLLERHAAAGKTPSRERLPEWRELLVRIVQAISDDTLVALRVTAWVVCSSLPHELTAKHLVDWLGEDARKLIGHAFGAWSPETADKP